MSIDSEVTMDNSKEMDEYEAVDEELVAEYLTCRFFTCSSCGEEIYINGGQDATKCVYCGKSTLAFSREEQIERPEYLLPFRITEEDANRAIRKNYKRGLFISRKLKHFKSTDIQKMYIPYWLVDGNHLEADVFNTQSTELDRMESDFGIGEALIDSVLDSLSHPFFASRYSRRGHMSSCVVNHRHGRAGKVRFRSLPVDGSICLSDYSSARVEPFDLSCIQKFNEKDIEGIYACASDIRYKDLYHAVNFRASKAFQDQAEESIHSRTTTLVNKNNKTFIDKRIHSALFPMYFASFQEHGIRNTVLINGQTGKVVYGVHFKQPAFISSIILLSAALTYPIALGIRFLRLNLFEDGENMYENISRMDNHRSMEPYHDYPFLSTFFFYMCIMALFIILVFSILYCKKVIRKLKVDESSTFGVFQRKRGW